MAWISRNVQEQWKHAQITEVRECEEYSRNRSEYDGRQVLRYLDWSSSDAQASPRLAQSSGGSTAHNHESVSTQASAQEGL